MSEEPPAPKRRWKRCAWGLSAALILFYVGDALYAAVVAYRVSAWESSVVRSPEGVLRGCEAYKLTVHGESEHDTAFLFVHGINASPKHYNRLAPELYSRGYSCRVMRLPGFAEPFAAYEKTTSDQWVGAVRDELAALRTEHDRVGIVAHSLGGAVTIGALLEDPEAADFAVLLAPAVEVSSSRSPIFSTRAWHEFATHVLVFTDTLSSPFTIDTRDPNITDWPGRTPFTPVAVVDELYGLMDRNRTRAMDFRTPVLMVLSRTDRVVDTPSCEAYYNALGAEQKSLLMLEESGHAIPVDQEWMRVVDSIDEFAAAMRADD